MTHRIGTKGQVVIPKSMRDQTGLQPGVGVDFELRGDEIVVRRHRERKSLKGLFKGGPDMAAQLLEDRAREPR